MKNIHKKRLTPNNLVVDMMNSLYEHKDILKLIDQLNTKNQTMNSTFIESINKHLGINLHDVSNEIMNSISRVLNEYNEHAYWRVFNQEEILLDVNTTLGETISYLEQMISPKDSQIIISNMLSGNILWILNHLKSLCQNSPVMSKQITYDYQRSSLEKIINALDNPNEFKTSINSLKRTIDKLKPLKPVIKNKIENSYLCLICHQELIEASQKYCHHCGQRLSEY